MGINVKAVLVFLFASAIVFGGDKKCSKMPEGQVKIFHQLEAIQQVINLDKQIKMEFIDMSAERAKLPNEEVKVIMRPHIEKIRAMEKQRQEIQ